MYVAHKGVVKYMHVPQRSVSGIILSRVVCHALSLLEELQQSDLRIEPRNWRLPLDCAPLLTRYDYRPFSLRNTTLANTRIRSRSNNSRMLQSTEIRSRLAWERTGSDRPSRSRLSHCTLPEGSKPCALSNGYCPEMEWVRYSSKSIDFSFE